MKAFYIVLLTLFFHFAHLGLQAQSVVASGSASFCSSSNPGFVSIPSGSYSVIEWESSVDGISWTSIANTALIQSYSILTQSTCYRAITQSGAMPPDTSTSACITVYLPSNGGLITGAGTFCSNSGTGNLTLSGNVGSPIAWEFSTDNGLSWTSVPDTNLTLPYSGITQNTIYRVIVRNGSSCPSDTSSIASFIIDSASSAGTVMGSDTVCSGANSGTLNLSGNTGNITNWIFSNNNGSTWNSITNTASIQPYSNLTQSTLFSVVVKNNTCPSDTSLPVLINVLPAIIINAGNDTSILLGESLTLSGAGNGSLNWSPSNSLNNPYIFNPVSTPASSTTYTLTVTDTNGCSSSDNVTITVLLPEFDGMVSNLFTPNGDGINDTWYIQNIQSFQGNEVFVYNIYGNEVYKKKEYTNDWKGTYNGADLPDGTYYYIIKFEGQDKILKGSVDILRNK